MFKCCSKESNSNDEKEQNVDEPLPNNDQSQPTKEFIYQLNDEELEAYRLKITKD